MLRQDLNQKNDLVPVDYSKFDDQSHYATNEYQAVEVDLDTRHVHGQEAADVNEFTYEEEGVLEEDDGIPEM